GIDDDLDVVCSGDVLQLSEVAAGGEHSRTQVHVNPQQKACANDLERNVAEGAAAERSQGAEVHDGDLDVAERVLQEGEQVGFEDVAVEKVLGTGGEWGSAEHVELPVREAVVLGRGGENDKCTGLGLPVGKDDEVGQEHGGGDEDIGLPLYASFFELPGRGEADGE